MFALSEATQNEAESSFGRSASWRTKEHQDSQSAECNYILTISFPLYRHNAANGVKYISRTANPLIKFYMVKHKG